MDNVNTTAPQAAVELDLVTVEVEELDGAAMSGNCFGTLGSAGCPACFGTLGSFT